MVGSLWQSPTLPESHLLGLFLQPPWYHLEGHIHMALAALTPAGGEQGGPCPPAYTLRCPPCSVFVFLLVKHLACFLFQNMCGSCCEAEAPGSWREIGPQRRGAPDL